MNKIQLSKIPAIHLSVNFDGAVIDTYMYNKYDAPALNIN